MLTILRPTVRSFCPTSLHHYAGALKATYKATQTRRNKDLRLQLGIELETSYTHEDRELIFDYYNKLY